MPPVIRHDDTSTHGGRVVSGASKYRFLGKLVARKGDILICDAHGEQPIVEGSTKYNFEGQPVAREGDKAACGAALIASQSKYSFE